MKSLRTASEPSPATDNGSAAPDGAVRKGGRTRISSIYQSLRDRISFFDYPPQMVLKEASLAQEFGVSRTPIRQILQMLESERLVEIRDGVGIPLRWAIASGLLFHRRDNPESVSPGWIV